MTSHYAERGLTPALISVRWIALVYARHVADPELVAGGVNLWGESPLYACPVAMKGYHL